MATYGEWWKFHQRMVQFERERPGVYELADKDKNVVYIGCAADVKTRLLQHLAEGAETCIRKNVQRYRVAYADDYESRKAEALAEYTRVHGRPPFCNEEAPSP